METVARVSQRSLLRHQCNRHPQETRAEHGWFIVTHLPVKSRGVRSGGGGPRVVTLMDVPLHGHIRSKEQRFLAMH